jgi:hypothetical protein
MEEVMNSLSCNLWRIEALLAGLLLMGNATSNASDEFIILIRVGELGFRRPREIDGGEDAVVQQKSGG